LASAEGYKVLTLSITDDIATSLIDTSDLTDVSLVLGEEHAAARIRTRIR
jgi:hypothetical protein